jgi:hypothetical protein
MSGWKLIGLVMIVALVSAGCASSREGYVSQQLTMYSSMDATALVYSDPLASAFLDDHPLRWMGFALYPMGVAIDYAVNRPLYNLASTMPGLFGYNSEDAMLNAQRLSLRR